ncbi:hypothetical protein SELR_pSRC500070 (plasmid) [Selenomonas ruminantium subsp. lactilytica TAM6421]|uniref:Uncharacterized protein n=1 Tax=Selenomonas ruminantium subsp. lactilytica (strain NBRC 103574 / TAM6421) TaxID=927704 RepID=I0GWP4_SELRL|nr:hypothetical protein SELR_pSRC500070 [Selenomonas ruminantium subsp. lactilytica TAM6421]
MYILIEIYAKSAAKNLYEASNYADRRLFQTCKEFFTKVYIEC